MIEDLTLSKSRRTEDEKKSYHATSFEARLKSFQSIGYSSSLLL